MYERTLDVDHRNVTVWLKYAEMEMRYRMFGDLVFMSGVIAE